MADPRLTLIPHPDGSPPEVELRLNWAGQASAQVQRLDPDGRWRPVRTGEPATLTGGLWIGHDVEASYGAPLGYRAISGSTIVVGVVPAQPGRGGGFDPAGFTPAGFDTTSPVPGSPETNRVLLAVDRPWLVHPGSPSLSQPLEVRTLEPIVTAIRQATFQVVGRVNPVVVSQARSAAAYSMTVLTETLAGQQGLTDLLGDGSTLYWNVPVTLGWGLPTGWVAVSDVQWEHQLTGYAGDPAKVWTLPLKIVDRPVGGQAQQWSCAALVAEQATCQDVLDHYESSRALLAHKAA